MVKWAALFLLLYPIAGHTAEANELKACWVPPTENVGGTPLTDLAGYTLYWGPTTRNYTSSDSSIDSSAVCHTVTTTPGQYFVAMTASNDGGDESAYSNEVLKTVVAGILLPGPIDNGTSIFLEVHIHPD